MATTLCFINQKGGCGKSSTCFHLSGCLAELGFQVLLIDADPQGSLSQAFFGSAEIERLTAEETLAVLFDDGCHQVSADAITLPTSFERISLIPANHTLAAHNSPSPELAGLKQQTLRAHLEPSPRYDFVLIDCPPNLYLCSWTAMLAADAIVIPVPPEDFGTQGLRVSWVGFRHLTSDTESIKSSSTESRAFSSGARLPERRPGKPEPSSRRVTADDVPARSGSHLPASVNRSSTDRW